MDDKPIVVVNSVPKSGTHLLHSLLSQLPGYKDSSIHFFADRYVKSKKEGVSIFKNCDPLEEIANLTPGTICTTHLSANERTVDFFKDNNEKIRMFLMYRHPLDIIISGFRYNTYSDVFTKDCESAKTVDFYNNAFSNDKQRLMFQIRQNPTFDDYLNYAKWLELSEVMPLRFEEVYADLCGEISTDVFGRMMRFLEINENEISKGEIWNKVAYEGNTATPIRKKIDQFRSLFDDSHWDLVLDTDAFEIARKFGYKIEHFNKPFCLFGAGGAMKEAFKRSFDPEMIDCIYDNDVTKVGSEYCDIPVRAADEINPERDCHYIITSVHHMEITAQLFGLGVRPGCIHVWRGLRMI